MRQAVLCVLGLLVAASAACGADSTTGRPVLLRMEIAADEEIDRPFETDASWTVQVTRAALSLGALYYFDGEPAFAHRARAPLLQQLVALVRPSVAHAHPGHYVAGTARGQMTSAAALALRSEPVALAEGSGITGAYRSARVVLASADELSGMVAVLEGSASKGANTIRFRLAASFADVARSASRGEVNGCVFEEAEVASDGTISMRVKPSVWLSFVDFSELEPGSAEQPTQVASGEAAQVAFALGVAQLSAYRFSYRADSE